MVDGIVDSGSKGTNFWIIGGLRTVEEDGNPYPSLLAASDLTPEA
jgi:hypothetical protein